MKIIIQPQTYRELSQNINHQVLRPIYATEEDLEQNVEIIDEDNHGQIIGYEYRPSRQWQKDFDYNIDRHTELDIYPYMKAYIDAIDLPEGETEYGWIF